MSEISTQAASAQKNASDQKKNFTVIIDGKNAYGDRVSISMPIYMYVKLRTELGGEDKQARAYVRKLLKSHHDVSSVLIQEIIFYRLVDRAI
jgi:hypothetical protein